MVIMLFTDGIEEWPTNVVLQHLESYPNNNVNFTHVLKEPFEQVRVFGYSMGFNPARAPLEWIACETRGESTEIDTISKKIQLKKIK